MNRLHGPPKENKLLHRDELKGVLPYKHHRLMEPLSYIPPAEFEANYHQRVGQAATV